MWVDFMPAGAVVSCRRFELSVQFCVKITIDYVADVIQEVFSLIKRQPR